MKVVLLLLVLPIAWGWYVVAADYDYSALSGTYVFSGGGEKCILRLEPNETFTQILSRDGKTSSVQGSWHRYGEAHVSFSAEFIPLVGEDLKPLGAPHGQFDKTFGFFPSLTLAPLPDGPTFRKKLFR
ncbi:hypothetical protein SAMN05421770_101319 [Granulicella rosea]|uniref:Uncharacterized protein n=2 Tax=Granulicella rosea TaxID=474952 RepID=A0A239D6M2_9BACT|nr:hypothetical protein SAMN05421770_101319 [Granulicella rosea]